MENFWVALAVAAMVLAGTFGIAWRFRVRAMKRWLTVLDTFADREIAREQRHEREFLAADVDSGLRQTTIKC